MKRNDYSKINFFYFKYKLPVFLMDYFKNEDLRSLFGVFSPMIIFGVFPVFLVEVVNFSSKPGWFQGLSIIFGIVLLLSSIVWGFFVFGGILWLIIALLYFSLLTILNILLMPVPAFKILMRKAKKRREDRKIILKLRKKIVDLERQGYEISGELKKLLNIEKVQKDI